MVKNKLLYLSLIYSLILFTNLIHAEETNYTVISNPLAGFEITVPSDWGMGTGILRDTIIGINYPLFPSPTSPYITFTYSAVSPLEALKFMALFLQDLAVTPPQAHPTNNKDAYELTATFDGGIAGPVLAKWLFRKEKNKTYIVGVIVLANSEEKFAEKIKTALESCHLIDRSVITSFFREPTLDAFVITLPYQWTYTGNVVSGLNLPAAYIFDIKSPDGLTGCFSSPPIDGQMTGSTQSLAYGTILESLRQKIPDIQVENIECLTEATTHYTQYQQLFAQIYNSQNERAFIYYTGTYNGTPVRVRVETYLRVVKGLIPGVGDYTHCDISGIWAPVNNYKEQSNLAYSVLASLWETPSWRMQIQKTTDDVVKFRNKINEKAAEKWDSYIRSVDVWTDPVTGKKIETPYGCKAAKDSHGNLYSVPEGQDIPGGMTELEKL
jgi:hypothetical protein